MARRFVRHNIVGSEVSRARPIAYLRRGWPRRRAFRSRRGLAVLAVLLALLATVVAARLTGA